jgi:hypothetical protein
VFPPLTNTSGTNFAPFSASAVATLTRAVGPAPIAYA